MDDNEKYLENPIIMNRNKNNKIEKRVLIVKPLFQKINVE